MVTRVPEDGTRNGEMAEWFKAAVLKTVEVKASGGSNPSLSAFTSRSFSEGWLFFIIGYTSPVRLVSADTVRKRIPFILW